MRVKLLQAICGYAVDQVVSISDERGMLWIRRGFALPTRDEPVTAKPEPEKPVETKPAIVETAMQSKADNTAMKQKAKPRR